MFIKIAMIICAVSVLFMYMGYWVTGLVNRGFRDDVISYLTNKSNVTIRRDKRKCPMCGKRK